MLSFNRKKAGFTLIELVVAMGFFTLLGALMYGTFNLIQRQVSATSSQNILMDKGQRIMSFMEEDIRMVGFLLGPDARIPYCTGSTVPPAEPNLISHTKGNPFDSLTFLTSMPVRILETKDCEPGAEEDYYLTTVGQSDAGTSLINVDASGSCYDDLKMSSPVNSVNNGRSLITFDSLRLSAAAVAGSAPQVYYSLNGLGNPLSLNETLQQNIPDGSTVYVIKQYQYQVDTTGGRRNLRRLGWDKNCAQGGGVISELVATTNAANSSGGVDGLKFEFTFIDPMTNKLVTSNDPPTSYTDLKSITVWLLLRGDRPDPDYTSSQQYILGTSADKITLGPYNDHYRRLLLYKTVEVKNLASIS